MRARRQRALRLASLALLALAVLAIPAAAQAWAPLAHLSFSTQAMVAVGAAPAATRELLQEFAHDFLYGSLAADIVVGKNLARYVHHCHNWRVGFDVQRAARTGAERAFALGILAHLAADTIAHNYFVPYQTVASFHRPRTGHLYWELRYDQRMDLGLTWIGRAVSDRSCRGHDDFLCRSMPRSSVLPFPLSRGLFGSMLASARHARFQSVSRLALARHRALVLDDDLVAETNRLSVSAIVGLLHEGEGCLAARADPTGARNLRLAARLRGSLRRSHRRLPLALASAVTLEARESFRHAIAGTLVLPRELARLAA